MGPCFSACVFCGYTLVQDNGTGNTWQGEFRTIYIKSSELYLSGIGLITAPEDGIYRYPADSKLSWKECPPDGLIELPATSLSPGYQGPFFHDACWCLLEKAFRANDVPLRRIFDICRSLPCSPNQIAQSWGGDMGGLLSSSRPNCYPWEERRDGFKADNEQAPCAMQDPFGVPEQETLFLNIPESPAFSIAAAECNDCFSRLPRDIIEPICNELPTQDAFQLRLVSRIFLPLMSNKAFWASRFHLRGERDFVFEAREMRESPDWRSLYKYTSAAHSSLGLQNRKRIWNLLLDIRDLCNLELTGTLDSHLLLEPSKSEEWNLVMGSAINLDRDGTPIPRESQSDFTEGCQVRGCQTLRLPNVIARIEISTCTVEGFDYVCGIHFKSAAGDDANIGYRSLNRQIVNGITSFKGFILAVGARGINAIKVLGENGSASRWCGRPKDTAITERLTGYEAIESMEASFDGFKMLSIKVSGSRRSISQRKSFREVALWYPDIPGKDLILNSDSYKRRGPLTPNFDPLFWIQFGGFQGANLRQLTGITVKYKDRIRVVSFRLNGSLEDTDVFTLGRGQSDGLQSQHFAIDGPGGERIEMVGIVADGLVENPGPEDDPYGGPINDIKFVTNRGRDLWAGRSPFKPLNQYFEILVPSPGSTITGLYATQNTEVGLLSLGIISEKLEELALNAKTTY